MANPDYFVLLEKATNGPTGGKFWIVEVYGQKVILTWGPIGKKGTSKEKTFGNPTSATRYAVSRESEKLSDGYHEASRNRSQNSAIKVATKVGPSSTQPQIIVKAPDAIAWDF